MALTETNLVEEINDFEINIKGYTTVRCDSVKKTTGGVILYIKNNIEFNVLDVRSIDLNCWTIAIEIDNSRFTCILVVIYHSPNSSHAMFIDF